MLGRNQGLKQEASDLSKKAYASDRSPGRKKSDRYSCRRARYSRVGQRLGDVSASRFRYIAARRNDDYSYGDSAGGAKA